MEQFGKADIFCNNEYFSGLIRGVDRTITGKAKPGEIFDTVFEVASAGVEGFIGGKFGGKAKAGKTYGKSLKHNLCKRSLPEELPKDVLEKLPGSFRALETKLGTQLSGLQGVETLVNGIFGFFLILNLMKNSSPSSSKFYQEVKTEHKP